MDFLVKAKELALALKDLKPIVPTKALHPAFTSVIVEADKSRDVVTLEATDGITYIRKNLTVEDVSESGVVRCSYALLYQYTSNTDGYVSVRSSDEDLVLNDEQDSSYSLKLYPESVVFNNTEDPDDHLDISLEDAQLFKSVLHCASKDPTKELLTTICLNVSKGTVTATDGHRLAKVSLNDLPSPMGSADKEERLTLPMSLVKSLLSAKSLTTLVYSNSFVGFQNESTYLSVRSLEGEYPKTDQLIPVTFDYVFSVGSEVLLNAVKRLQLMAARDRNVLTITLQADHLKLEAAAADIGEAYERILGKTIDTKSEPLTLGLNLDYFKEALMSSKGDLLLKANSCNSPVVLQSTDGLTNLIMPVQLLS